ncbi:MAG: orotidine 5'-phosphate decarboxylase / HUMPS family protein [Nanoarchaeota archaeon]
MDEKSSRVEEINMAIIKLKKSIIPSCDVSSIEELKKMVKETCDVTGIGAYKVGFELALPFGLNKVVSEIRKLTDLPIIYDHQKAGTDIPDMGFKFMKACKDSGVDAVIIFPQAGPVTEEAWINAAKKVSLKVIVGGEMTHKGYLESENGFLKTNSPQRMYQIASANGVKDYVVPGNKPDKIAKYRLFFENKGFVPVFYSPGLVTQGGTLSEGAKAAGDNWHAIIGRALYNAPDIRSKALELVKALE